MALEGVHAGESLPTQRARGHIDIGGRLAADAILLAEVRAQVDLQDVGAGEDFVAQGAHEDLARGAQDIGGSLQMLLAKRQGQGQQFVFY